MSITNIALIVFIVLMLAYAIYDEFLLDNRKGKTRLKVYLQRRNKLDAIIFIGLLAILLYQNIVNHGSGLTAYLLVGVALLAFYLSFVRWPKLRFKENGFYYATIFITYDRVKAMNLSEDGVLVVQLEQKPLLVRVKELDDLENIYKFMVNYQ